MTNINFLDKLLNGAEVEWKQLGDVLIRTKGTKITAGQMKGLHKENGVVKIFAGGKTVASFNLEDLPASDINRKPSIIVKSRGVIEFEYYDKPFSHKNEMWSYHSNSDHIHTKFFYHFLKLNEPHFQQIGSKMQMPQIATPDTDKFLVPIPCPDDPKKSLEIQGEIVRILDAFTELTTELTTERTTRKKQYNHYREKLLSFENGDVEWKTLGDVALPTSNIRWRDTERSYRYIDLTAVNIATKAIVETTEIHASNAPSRAQKLVEKNDLIFATTRPTQQRYCLIGEESSGGVASTGYCVLRANQEIVLPKWILHWIASRSFKTYVEENQSGSTYPAISDAKVKDFKIPIPCPKNPEKSLEIQAEIILTLDALSALTTKLTTELTAELTTRKKQSDYYRNLLLNFFKPDEGRA